MESVAKRRCANGQDCYHVRKLGLEDPVSLRSLHKGNICDKCREAGDKRPTSKQEHQQEATNTRLLSTRAASDWRKLKQDLVLQLFIQRGPFWDAVKDLRHRRSIQAVSGLPRGGRIFPFLPLPPAAGVEGLSKSFRVPAGTLEGDDYMRWRGELLQIIDKVVPERLRPRYASHDFFDWYGFIAACVLYDPPVDQLREFADMGGPWASALQSVSGDEDSNPTTYVIEVSPIRRLPDPAEMRNIETEYWSKLLEKLDELHLRQLGLKLDDLLANVHEHFPEIRRTKQEEMNQLKKGRFIEVDEYTTEEDVRKAFRALAEAHRSRPAAARPKRDKLLCVEVAMLHDQHGWTYEQLAERYEWKDPTRASKFLKDGRAILNE